MEPKRKMLVYKRVKFATAIGPATLQSLLNEAFKILPPNATDRMENPAADGKHFRLVNYHGSHGRGGAGGAFLGCELFSFNKDADQGTLAIDPNVAELPVHATSPPIAGQQFVEGAVYFGVLDNHVIVIQSSALRLHDLELHLNWFLRERAKVLPTGNMVSLDDYAPTGDQNFSDVKGFTFSAPVETKTEAGTEVVPSKEREAIRRLKTENKREDRKNVRVNLAGRGWEALRAFLADDIELPQNLPVEELLRTGKMHVTLSLDWTARGGQDAAQFIESVAHRLRHITDEFDYAVDTKSGRITKDEFKLRTPKDINWGTVRPDLNDVFGKMIEYLDQLLETKKIKP